MFMLSDSQAGSSTQLADGQQMGTSRQVGSQISTIRLTGTLDVN